MAHCESPCVSIPWARPFTHILAFVRALSIWTTSISGHCVLVARLTVFSRISLSLTVLFCPIYSLWGLQSVDSNVLVWKGPHPCAWGQCQNLYGCWLQHVKRDLLLYCCAPIGRFWLCHQARKETCVQSPSYSLTLVVGRTLRPFPVSWCNGYYSLTWCLIVCPFMEWHVSFHSALVLVRLDRRAIFVQEILMWLCFTGQTDLGVPPSESGVWKGICINLSRCWF